MLLFLHNIFENTICVKLLQRLRVPNRGNLFDRRFFSFYTLLAQKTSGGFFSLLSSLPNLLFVSVFAVKSSLFYFLSLRHPLFLTLFAPRYQKEISRDYFILFFNILRRAECRTRFTYGEYNVWDILWGLQEALNDEAKNLLTVNQNRVLRDKQPVVLPGHRGCQYEVPRECGTWYNRRVPWVPMAVSARAMKDIHLKELVTTFLRLDNSSNTGNWRPLSPA